MALIVTIACVGTHKELVTMPRQMLKTPRTGKEITVLKKKKKKISNNLS